VGTWIYRSEFLMMVRMQMWLAARQEGVQKRAYVRMLRTPSRRRAGERLGHTTQRYQQHVKVHGRPWSTPSIHLFKSGCRFSSRFLCRFVPLRVYPRVTRVSAGRVPPVCERLVHHEQWQRCCFPAWSASPPACWFSDASPGVGRKTRGSDPTPRCGW
jgi:hypothetical protein